MKKLPVLVAGLATVACLGACGSSSTSGTEVLTGSVTGAAAANLLNSTTNITITLQKLTFSGPVDTSVSQINLGDGGTKATHTFVTPAGNFVVTRTVKNQGQSQPTPLGRTGSTCYFKATFSSGDYTVDGSQSTGSFEGATGSGTFVITATAAADLLPGKTTCTGNNTGNVLTKGASIDFKASGPLTVKS